MLVAIITDTHWSARKSSKLFHDYFELFYKNVFFPTLEQYGITTVIHMGDAFDNRKSIDFWGLDWTRKVVLDPLSKYDVHMIVGNHDTYYKNTNNINSPSLLLKNYKNIKTYSEAKIVNIGNLNILFIPWICADNQKRTFNLIENSNCKVAMGHLELSGFEAYRGHIMDDGMDPSLFGLYQKVFSGHYHTRSNNRSIFYLGNPYEMFWNDVDDPRGFTIFDTETLEHYSINNPYTLFKIIYYSDNDYQTLDTSEYEGKIVKIIVRKKTDPKQFEKYVDKIYLSGVAELKIVENFQIIESEDFDMSESEDTLSLLNKYIDESEIDLDKSIIQKVVNEIYQESYERI